MKVLLIEPAKGPTSLGGEEYFIYEPLALEYLAAGIADHHDVKLLDMRLDKDLPGALEIFQPDVVGITAYTVHVNSVLGLLQDVKAWNPDVLTVVGGHHATIRPSDLSSPATDLIVVGEGVDPFREIVIRLEKGMNYSGIPGVMYQRDGELVGEEPLPASDPDSSPFPLRSVSSAYRGDYYSEWMKPLASMRTSRGCPFRCSFCAQWKIAKGKYLRRKPECIAEELAGIDEPYVFFADDESMMDVERMLRLAGLIEASGMRKEFFLYARSDTIVRHPELFEAWRGIGLSRVFVGLEFFRDEDLQYIRKSSSIEDNNRAVGILHDMGIGIYASFIVRPSFTRPDFKALVRYCHELEVDFASFAVLTPLPGTDLYEEVKDSLLTHDYDYFDFNHTLLPTELPMDVFYQEMAALYRRAVPPRKVMALLRKYPLREIPGLFRKGAHLQRSLKNAWKDYDFS
ncbi:B12-binding domain-containing radical SAM protein [Gemmatimonadota bacterium]